MEEQELRYLRQITLESDGQIPNWIAIHEVGSWKHSKYGPFDMTLPKMDKAMANFKGCVHRPRSPVELQVPVDTRHSGDESCGWLQDMKVAKTADGTFLLGKIGWTERGKEIIKDKRYLFVSPVYVDDPEKGPIFKEVTLTNRDFLHMPPIGSPIALSRDVVEDVFAWPAEGEGRFSLEEGGSRTMTKKKVDKKLDGAPPADKGQKTPPAVDTIQLTAEEHADLMALAKGAAESKKHLDAANQRILALEEEGKAAEVTQALGTAGRRGVDAFTLNWAGSMLKALPRRVPDEQVITLEMPKEDDKTEEVKVSLYGAVLYLLEQTPAVVPLGEDTKVPAGKKLTSEGDEEDEAEVKELSESLLEGMNLEVSEDGDGADDKGK